MQYRTLASWPLIVSLLLIGCGKMEPKAPWPGYIKSINGFEESEKSQIKKAIDSLNEQAGKTLVSEEEGSSNFTIEISKVSASSWPTARAGFATVNTTLCRVEISDMLFTSAKKEYLYPVVWHELGHCSGLMHLKGEGEIMSPMTSVLAAYPATVIEKFISSVRESAGL